MAEGGQAEGSAHLVKVVEQGQRVRVVLQPGARHCVKSSILQVVREKRRVGWILLPRSCADPAQVPEQGGRFLHTARESPLYTDRYGTILICFEHMFCLYVLSNELTQRMQSRREGSWMAPAEGEQAMVAAAPANAAGGVCCSACGEQG